jgi:hypothetical protein
MVDKSDLFLEIFKNYKIQLFKERFYLIYL